MDARAWDERYDAGEPVWSLTPNQFVAQDLQELAPGRALDLAAGEGRNALWLAGRGWRVTAVDFSRAGLATGRRLQGQAGLDDSAVDWVCADALTWEPGAPGFDLVVLAYLQLVEDERRTAVRHAFAALRPGGTFFLVAHDSTNLTEGTGGPTDASVLFTAEEVLGDLDGERFEVQRAERVARVVPAAGTGEAGHTHDGEQDRTAWDALVRVVAT